jgi:paraquat-inducible protein A
VASPRPLLVAVLLSGSLGCNIAALLLPFIVIDAAGSAPWVYGLFGSVQMLWDAHMYVLAVMVFTFSVIFPFTKIAALGWLWRVGVTTPGRRRLLAWVEQLGKWSLFDVFLVSIMVALTNDQWLISSESLPGLTCFLIAVVLGMLAGEVLTAVVGHEPEQPPVATAPRSAAVLALVLATGVLQGATLAIPFIQIDDWRLADRAYSLITLVPALWQNGSPILAVSVGLFIIVIPAIHLLVALVMTLTCWNCVPSPWSRHLRELIGRWSMMAVFAMSLAVFLAEGHRFLGTEPMPGVWTLAAGLGLAWLGQSIIGRMWR